MLNECTLHNNQILSAWIALFKKLPLQTKQNLQGQLEVLGTVAPFSANVFERKTQKILRFLECVMPQRRTSMRARG